MDFVRAIERSLGLKATIQMLPMQAGDVPDTFADVEDLIADFNYTPKTTIEDGIEAFVTWYKSYFNV